MSDGDEHRQRRDIIGRPTPRPGARRPRPPHAQAIADAVVHQRVYGVVSTGRRDGSPQQSMLPYLLDDDVRIVITGKAHAANATLPAVPRSQ